MLPVLVLEEVEQPINARDRRTIEVSDFIGFRIGELISNLAAGKRKRKKKGATQPDTELLHITTDAQDYDDLQPTKARLQTRQSLQSKR